MDLSPKLACIISSSQYSSYYHQPPVCVCAECPRPLPTLGNNLTDFIFCLSQDELDESAAFISRGLEMKFLRPVIGGSYTMEQASNAHNDIINAKGAKGKLVMLID